MTSVEQRSRTVLCWGRLADALTREVVPFRRFTAALLRSDGVVDVPEYKEDGHFAFADDSPSTASVTIAIEGLGFERRTISQTLTGSPLELSYPGEDELYVLVNQIQVGPRRVSFDPIPFLPTVPAGATVAGTSGFSTTLSTPMEGENVQAATLTTVTGLAVGAPLRFVRSTRLLLRPGPSYPFGANQTLVDLTVVADATGDAIGGATATIIAVNGAPLATESAGGLTLYIAALAPPAPQPRLVMGSVRDLQTHTDARGRVLYFYPPATAITTLRFTVAAAGFVTQSLDVPVVQRTRTARTVRLAV